MILLLFFLLLIGWLIGVVSNYTFGGAIHILLVIAVVGLLYELISGRRAPID